MFQLMFVVALIGVLGSAWWGWLRFGPLGTLPAGVSVMLLFMMHYGGRLYIY